MLVPAVSDMLADEMLRDAELVPALQASGVDQLMPAVKRAVGMAHSAWKRQNPGLIMREAQIKPIKNNHLPWPSIEAYPEWIVGQIRDYLSTLKEEPWQQVARRRALEYALLENPLQAASVKYDGTCFGKLDTGQLVGRKMLHYGDEYQQTSVAATQAVDVSELQQRLSNLLDTKIESLCLWGELMCNPGYYNYKDRGLHAAWLCFGVVTTLAELDLAAQQVLQERLTAHNLAYSLSGTGSKLRLMLCPALRRILEQTTGCMVADDLVDASTHAEMVASAALNLCRGEDEGLVVVFKRPDGQSSLRKWKNSGEGCTISQKHAQMLRECQTECQGLVDQGLLDGNIVKMVTTLIKVAEAQTKPMKIGRSKFR